MLNESRPARPWDILNKNIKKVETDVSKERMAICRNCPELLPTGNCKICKCFMSIKTKLPNASCPLGKWDKVTITYKEKTDD